MKALRWDGKQLHMQVNCPEPTVPEDWALVRISLAGICSTDLQILQGYMGFRGIPGHEFVGTVVAGPVGLQTKRVVGEINFACGRCEWCHKQLGRHCPQRRVMGILEADGSFAEYLTIPVANLHIVPNFVSDEEAVFAEPLAAAFEVLEQLHLVPGTEVVVLGDGKLGMLCAQVLHLAGAGVTVVGKHEKKLAVLRNLGIWTVALGEWQPHPVGVVIEATGSTQGLQMAMATLRPRGTLVMKSTVVNEHRVSLAPLVIHEITVVGSRCGRFSPALQALAQKRIVTTGLIDQVYPLSEGVTALQHAARSGVLKVLLRPD
ncbi:MAG: alcohol dehydrogenase catalytic domain-containing protein [Candidatus Binatia bacterium]